MWHVVYSILKHTNTNLLSYRVNAMFSHHQNNALGHFVFLLFFSSFCIHFIEHRLFMLRLLPSYKNKQALPHTHTYVYNRVEVVYNNQVKFIFVSFWTMSFAFLSSVCTRTAYYVAFHIWFYVINEMEYSTSRNFWFLLRIEIPSSSIVSMHMIYNRN